MLKQGLLITFEGIDGSGKSTVINALNQKLHEYFLKNNLSIDLIQTREPGGYNNLLAEKIRDLILDKNYQMPDITEALLFAASRSAHVELTIKPALIQKKIVLCDRFLDSSIVYQGYVKKLGKKLIAKINKCATNKISPDIIFYFKIDPSLAQKRMNNDNRSNNRIDNMEEKFHQNVALYYEKHFAHKSNVVKIDASSTIETIIDKCLDKIITYIKTKYE